VGLVASTNQGHGKPAVTIFVNTRQFAWDDKSITYEQVYDLAYPTEPLNDGDEARIEFSRGPHGSGAGTLRPGESVKVKVNMVFDVYVTVRS
jgi:hypothetical protein